MNELIHIIYSYDTAKGDQWALEKFSQIAGNRIARYATPEAFDRIENQFGRCTARIEAFGTTYLRVAVTPENYAILDELNDSIGPIKREDYPGYVTIVDPQTQEETQAPNRDSFVIDTGEIDPETLESITISFGVWA